MENKEYPDEGLGFTEERFKAEEAKRRTEVEAYGREFWSRPQRYFFIFRNTEERDRALQEISQAREYDESLLQLSDWHHDPMRPDRGLQLNFRQGRETLRQKLLELFKTRGFYVEENYAPDEKVGAKVVEMPKRGGDFKQHEAA